MGFFSSMRELNQTARDLQANNDPEARAQQMSERMSAMTQLLADQTKAANLAGGVGVAATATISAVQQTGTSINMQPTLRLDLLVFPPGGAPYPVTVTQVVDQMYLAKAAAGGSIAVKTDPDDPQTVWIDWAAS